MWNFFRFVSISVWFSEAEPLPLTVRENVLFGYKLHNPGKLDKADADNIVEGALKKVMLWDQIKDRLDTTATSLSLEKQKLVLRDFCRLSLLFF